MFLRTAEELAGTVVLFALPAVTTFALAAGGAFLVFVTDRPDWAVDDGTTDFFAPDPILTDPNPDESTTFFATVTGPALSFPSSSFLAAIKLTLALLATVSLGRMELTLPLPPVTAAVIVFGAGLALNSVLFLVTASASASSFFSRSSRCAFILAAIASPGREKVDLVGGLADLVVTKPGFEVERLVLVVLLFWLVPVTVVAGCVGFALAAVLVSPGDQSPFVVVIVEDRG